MGMGGQIPALSSQNLWALELLKIKFAQMQADKSQALYGDEI